MTAFDCPAYRASLTPAEYERQRLAHVAATTVETANGHAIRTAQSRFGRLFTVGNTGRAFTCQGQARAFALFGEVADTSTEALCDAFRAYAKAEQLPDEGDALELLHADITDAQRAWLSAFVIIWDAVQEREDAARAAA